MSRFGSAYRDAEKNKFEKWEEDIDAPKFPVYVMSGDEYWKKEMIDRMSASLGMFPTKVGEKLKVHTDKMRYRSIRRKMRFVLFESKNEILRKEDMDTLTEYFSDPSQNGILIVSLKDRAEKNFFLRNFKMIKKSSKIKYYEMDFVSDYFKKLHVMKKLDDYTYKFESEKLRETTIKNLILRMDELVDNLEMLNALNAPIIGKDDVKSSIEEYSDNNMMKFYESLALLNRKKVPFVILNELLDDGVKPLSIMRGIRRHFQLLYQAKYLKLNGLLRANDVEEIKKDMYLDAGIIFKGNVNIWEISKGRRNRYLEECDKIMLKDILHVMALIDSHFTTTRTRKGDRYVYTDYVSTEQMMTCIIEIMNRREEY